MLLVAAGVKTFYVSPFWGQFHNIVFGCYLEENHRSPGDIAMVTTGVVTFYFIPLLGPSYSDIFGSDEKEKKI